jgi:Xaa-Pro dipeptidase
MWTSEQIKDHKEAASRLLKIKDGAFEYIRKNKKISELEIQAFIYRKFKERGMKTADQPQIVAFGPNSAIPHYYPTSKTNRILKKGDVIKIDIWARMNKKGAPFADITWMGFCGEKVPKNIEKIFNIVVSARNKGINFIKNNLKKKNLPTGREVDKVVRDYIHQYGHGDKFIHGTGHSLGFLGPHGKRSRISKKGRKPIRLNTAYTIEPGIYLEGKFGVRSEIDFYVTENYKLILTTKAQKRIIKV